MDKQQKSECVSRKFVGTFAAGQSGIPKCGQGLEGNCFTKDLCREQNKGAMNVSKS